MSDKPLDLSKLSKEDLVEMLARELLDRKANEQASKHEEEKQRIEEQIAKVSKETHTCPKCGRTGQVGKMFGLKPPVRGKIYKQSWCRDCRSGTNYHREPRKYGQVAHTSPRRKG